MNDFLGGRCMLALVEWRGETEETTDEQRVLAHVGATMLAAALRKILKLPLVNLTDGS